MSWKQIPNFDNYNVNHKGKIKNLKTNKIVNGSLNSEGYRRVTLCNNGLRKDFYIHRIVASVFVDNPNNYDEVHHINSKRDDNRSCNLKWVTHAENMKYIYDKDFKYKSFRYNNQQAPIKIKRHVLHRIQEEEVSIDGSRNLSLQYA